MVKHHFKLKAAAQNTFGSTMRLAAGAFMKVNFMGSMPKCLAPVILLMLMGCGVSDQQLPADGRRNAAIAQASVTDSQALRSRNITEEVSESRHNAITRAVEKLSPAVVGINVTQIKEFRRQSPIRSWYFDNFYPQLKRQLEVKSLGSGFLISADGYIVTNEHVVHNAVKVSVSLANGKKYEAEIIGTDYITDVALLKIDDNGLPYCELGDSDTIILGEWVIALGNPFGLFEVGHQATATVGVISGSGLDFGRQGDDRVYQAMIQTDAAINPGNSGGAMANALGEVIGMNTFIYTGDDNSQGSIGLGFAIPSNRIEEVVAQLRRYGQVDRQFWTGLEVEGIRPSVARYFGLQNTNGVIVSGIDDDSPAEDAGFQVGDIVTEFGGRAVSSTLDIWQILEDMDARAGNQIEITVMRGGVFHTLQLTLGKIEDGPM